MTKGLACGLCADLRLLPRADNRPVECQCGNVAGWWLDGHRGVARFSARDEHHAFGVGVNNRFFVEALIKAHRSPQEWRQLHENACNAPGFLFDATRRNCWVVVFEPGMVADVEWATEEERLAVGLSPYPAWHHRARASKQESTGG